MHVHVDIYVYPLKLLLLSGSVLVEPLDSLNSGHCTFYIKLFTSPKSNVWMNEMLTLLSSHRSMLDSNKTANSRVQIIMKSIS